MLRTRIYLMFVVMCLIVVGASVSQAVADDNGQTAVLTQAPLDLSRITRVQTPGIDLSAVALEDEQNEAQG
ncbi:MAG: hypothetical protein ABII12_13340, partial [Planctomycetota bacterium]